MQTKEQAFFFDAIRRGDEADVRKVCELFPELINAADVKGFTPLIIAAYNNQPGMVRTLIAHGADLHAGDASGNTAMMGASFKGYLDIVEQLVAAGADVNQRNGQGATALTFAATFGQLTIAELLIRNGALLNIPDSRGKTPMDHAVIQQNEAMVGLLQSMNR